MNLCRLVSVACTLIASSVVLHPLRAEEGPLVTKLSVYRAYVDGQLSSVSVNADAYVVDAEVVGTPETVHIAYDDGTAVGSTPGGRWDVESTPTSFNASAGDVFEPNDELPAEGPISFQFEGGAWDGALAIHNLDFRYQPRRPDLHAAAQQKLVKARADKEIRVQLNGFRPAPGAVDAQTYFYVAQRQPGGTYAIVYQSDNYPANTKGIDLPAHTLGVGSFQLVLVHFQSSPTTATSGPVSHYTTHTLHVERTR